MNDLTRLNDWVSGYDPSNLSDDDRFDFFADVVYHHELIRLSPNDIETEESAIRIICEWTSKHIQRYWKIYRDEYRDYLVRNGVEIVLTKHAKERQFERNSKSQFVLNTAKSVLKERLSQEFRKNERVFVKISLKDGLTKRITHRATAIVLLREVEYDYDQVVVISILDEKSKPFDGTRVLRVDLVGNHFSRPKTKGL